MPVFKISEIITIQYDDILTMNDEVHSDFDHTAVFGDSFDKGFLTANYETLISKIFKLLNSASLSKLTSTDEELALIIKGEFIQIQEQLQSKALRISQELLKEFITGLKEPLDTFEVNLSNSERLLENHLLLLKEDENTRQAKSLQLYERIKKVELIFQRYSK